MNSTATALIDAILPGDPALGMPSASRTGVPAFLEVHGPADDVAALLARVEAIAGEGYDARFAALRPELRVTCVERARRADMRGVTAVLEACLRAYYTDPMVLRALGAGAVPPFPEGNALDEDDWTLLEPVYERGPMIRPAPPC